MASAYGQGDPPPELRIAWSCKRWNCLPEAGAYFDQDHALMYRMTTFTNVYNLMARWQALSGKDIHTLSENDRKTLRWLKDIGVLFQ